MLDSLPSLRDSLQEHGLWAKKSLGQHFLLDQNLTDKIVRCAGELSEHAVIEIGPGPGGLTRSILRHHPKQLIAIEKDRTCRPILEELQQAAPFQLIEADALTIKPQTLGNAPYIIIANLPYNVSTALLLHWFKDLQSIERMVLMFQKEVAQRLLAAPGSKSYGRLSVLTQFYCAAHHLMDVPPQAFVPPPKVDSSVVQLIPKAPRQDVDAKALENVTAAAFGQRRKMLRSSLKRLDVNASQLLENAGIEGELRAENLSLNDFCRLTQAYQKLNASPDIQP